MPLSRSIPDITGTAIHFAALHVMMVGARLENARTSSMSGRSSISATAQHLKGLKGKRKCQETNQNAAM